MGHVLWLAAAGLLVLSVLLDDGRVNPWLHLAGTTAQWLGLVVLLLALVWTCRKSLTRVLRQQFAELAGPSLINEIPPRIVLHSLLKRVYGNGRSHHEIVTGLLGGTSLDAAWDTAVSPSSSIHFRLETVDEKQCVSHIVWNYEISRIRNSHLLVIFATSDREIYELIQHYRVYPLYELLLVTEEVLEGFIPTLLESLRVGISYRDTSEGSHVIDPRPTHGEEVAFRDFDQYVRLPDHVDPQNLRILQIDLHDLAHDDHIVTAVEALTLHVSNVADFDLGYLMWSAPFPCFVHAITFDLTMLARPGEELEYQVHLGSMKGAGGPVNTWRPLTDPHIVVPVESWMLPGHSVRLQYRPLALPKVADGAQPG